MQEVKAVEIRNVGATVEGTAIRNSQEHVVKACVGNRRSQAAERRVRDAVCWDTQLTNGPSKPGFVGEIARNFPAAYECDTRFGCPPESCGGEGDDSYHHR